MTRSLFGTIVLAAALMAPSFAAASREGDRKAIEAIERGIATTMNVDDLPKYYAPDIVLYDMLGNFFDMAAVRKNFVDFMQNARSIEVDFQSLTIDSDGTMAFAYSIQKARFGMKDSTSLESTYRETDCLKKANGSWRIVHSQLSIPIDVTTGKVLPGNIRLMPAAGP